MPLEILTPNDAAWRRFLTNVAHDFYHLPGYAELAAAQEGGQAEAVLVVDGDNHFFLPYLRCSVAGSEEDMAEEPLSDIKSPYGYPCPLLRETRAGFLQAALAAWVKEMRRRGTVSGFFRLHPLFPEHIEALASFGSVRRRGTTVAIDLTLDDAEIWRRIRLNHRRNIEKSRQQGMVVTMECGHGALEEFAAIYRESMDRVGAAAGYYFPMNYFQALRPLLGDNLWFATARQPTGEALASLLLVECGPIVQYHLGGTRTAALPLAPTKRLFDEAWRWAKARGRRILHLGGGVGSAEDSLFEFKAGFSDRRYAFSTWQLVFLRETYGRLEARRRALVPSALRPEFFPAYRA